MRIFVEVGRASLLSKISNNFGTTIVIITVTTPITTIKINNGYIIAPFIFPEIESSFSICKARSSKTLLSKPVFSHDLIIQISDSPKLDGYNSKHSERFFHVFNSSQNLHKIFLKRGFFSCASRTDIAFTMLIHAFVIVDKRR
jgi:hypothetical protein